MQVLSSNDVYIYHVLKTKILHNVVNIISSSLVFHCMTSFVYHMKNLPK